MTTKSSKEVIIYHMILHWPVDIERLKKLKWRPINPVSIEFEFLLFVKSLLLFNINDLNMLNMSIHT